MRACEGLVAAALLFAASELRAQTIRGRVFLPDSLTPASGIVVTAVAEDGKPAAGALSSGSGDYTLKVSAAGRYQLRALQIGFRPTVVASVDVAVNGVRVQNIVLGRLPINLTAMLVRDEGCGISQRDGDTFLQLWEQARAALSATRLAEQGGSLDVHLVRIDGLIDAVRYYRSLPPSKYQVFPYEVVDSAHARESVVDRVIAATPAETLATAGYVRRRDAASVIFDMPSAEALLSDQFAEHHCFSVVKPPNEHRDWIGIGFQPRRKRNVVDVRGVLWLDRSSAELRRLEFTYANLPRPDYQMCDDAPANVEVANRKRTCQEVRDDDSNRLGLGGEAEFTRLAGGEWLVTRWTIRKPSDEGKVRKGYKCIPKRTSCDPCYDSSPQCQDVWLMWPRLVTTIGTISRVMRGDAELYRNDSSLALIQAVAEKRAGSRPAHLEGRITDPEGRPLSAAIIQTDDPGRVGVADSDGVFRIRTLPAGPIGILVRCRGYQPVQFKLPLLRDSTRRVSLALAADPTAARTSGDCSRVP